MAKKLGILYKLGFNKFYVDEIYDGAVVQPTYNFSNSFLYKIFDVMVIDGIVNGSAWVAGQSGLIFRKLQNGLVQNYAIVIVVGILCAIGYVIVF